MILVIDASALLGLGFLEEDPAYANSVVRSLAGSPGCVPAVWWLEVQNSLLQGERKKRISQLQTAKVLDFLGKLPIEVDRETYRSTVLALARRHSLTAYDAAYLELALRRNAVLATMDKALIRAAQAEGIALHG